MNWTAPYKNARRKFGAIAAAVALTASMGLCSGCASASTSDSSASGTFTVATTGTAKENVAADIQAAGYEFEYSDRDADASYDAASATSITFSDDGATVSGDGAAAEGSTVTITEEGTYVISGTSADGQIVVEVADDAKVQLVLDGVDLTNNSGPCIYVKSGDKVFVTLAEGSTNVLSDGNGWTLTGEDDEPNATLYSESDLTINGSGSLEVNATVNHGISTKDDLTVTGGTLDIESADDGLHGKDSVQINGGTITIDAQGDAIKSTETDKADKGFVSIDGGTLDLSSADDGIEASKMLRVTGGTVTVDSEDDALHSDIDVQITDGTITVDSEDDAVHGEYNVSVEGGTLTVNTCEEGLEGQCVEVSGGENYVASNDDGINASSADVETTDSTSTDGSADSADSKAASGASQQEQGQGPQGGNGGQGMQGGMMGDVEEECNITISGGNTTLVCLHDGDSIDTNGTFTMTDGTVYISGTTTNGNGALDTGVGSTITGGTILALSSNGMAETFGADSTQVSIVSTVSGSAGDAVSIVDESGNEVVSFTAVNDYSWLLASAPNMTEGASYNVMINGSLATTLSASTEQQGGAMGGGVPDGGQMPDGGQAPSDAEEGQGPGSGGQMPGRGGKGQMPSNGNAAASSSVQGTTTSA